MKETIRELVKRLEIKEENKEYEISLWRGKEHEVGRLPSNLIKSEMALDPMNMVYDAWEYQYYGSKYVIYVNAYDNIHYIALMYKLIGEHIQFQMENRD